MIRPLLTLLAAEVTAALSRQPSPTVAWARGLLAALQVDLPPVTAADVCGDAPAQCEAGEDECNGFSLPLKVALAMAKPRCAGCGSQVHTVVCGTEGEDGRAQVSDVTVACVNEHCGRLTDVVEFAEAATLEDGAMVAKLRPVVLAGREGWS